MSNGELSSMANTAEPGAPSAVTSFSARLDAVNLLAPKKDHNLESARVAGVCNACRYCESLCPVFSEMTRYRSFATADLNYLANLCHNCGACNDVCQYAVPHPFAVSVPAAFAAQRLHSYQSMAWPGFLARAIAHNPVVTVVLLSLTLVALVAGLVLASSHQSLWVSFSEQGGFYAVMPHNVMASLAGLTFGFAVLSLAVASIRFAKQLDIGLPQLSDWPTLRWALAASVSLRLLGDTQGCQQLNTSFSPNRRLFHHLMAAGFLLCFAATCVATWYHYGLGQPAPYAMNSLPVLLGALGGLGLVVGPLGLAVAKTGLPGDALNAASERLGSCLLALLAWVSITGLALLFGRDSAAMWLLLAVHLAAVFTLFVLLPFSKFLHAPLRFLALLKYAAGQPLPR